MNTVNEIVRQVEDSINQDFTFIESSDVQGNAISQDRFEAIVMTANVLFIHINQLSNIVESQGKRFAAKIFRLYRQVTQKFAEQTKAHFEIYDSNSFMIIYPDEIVEARYAVKRAMNLVYIFTNMLKARNDQFCQMDFTIGIDHGRILGTNEGRLVWRGTCIEKAKKISEVCLKPFRIGISGKVYSSLKEEDKNITKHILGIPKKEAIWERSSYDFHNIYKHLYSTRHDEAYFPQDNIV